MVVRWEVTLSLESTKNCYSRPWLSGGDPGGIFPFHTEFFFPPRRKNSILGVRYFLILGLLHWSL